MTIPEPIAIIGSGCRFPGNANTPEALFDVLRNPHDLLSDISEDRFSTRGYYHENGQYHGHTNVRQSYLLSGEGTHRRFDAQFFGISPTEANVIDPQMRLLLETVYEALEDAGQTIKGLQGSNTAVYAGLMTSDYEHMMSRDEDSMGTYHVTGTAKSLLSNRISYFFDWHGPSMTIDTACSSSLYAVHHAVQQLRSGASRVAVAAGANLLLDPVGYVGESKLQMLSPGSRSRMWDASADGYARGEGVAAIILKTLSDAEKDGDKIDCIIRETAVNQDGRTKGITVPSAKAQASLIRDCYNRAGLDISSPADRPQFFEAHGTGTPSGDPIEAEAISSVFFNHSINNTQTRSLEPLLVGSIKTILGHTEAVAGLAGILKASLALQHSVVPPNLLFNRLNPKIKPFYDNLHIPTTATPWPIVSESSPRRASVNSFGFGGANAHAILESYSEPPRKGNSNNQGFYPFIFSAASETSLIRYLESFYDYLRTNGASLNMRDLAYTLNSRRTRFPFVVSLSACTAKQLALKIDEYIEKSKLDSGDLLGAQPSENTTPKVLAIFTGQGAQWARMGARLVTESASARRVLEKLQARLTRLPIEDRPSWLLIEELRKEASSSRVNEAELSQTLSTAVGILLVDILRESHVELTAAVGFSSGEITAAYAAGIISAEDAICIAYYRGLHAKLAQGPGAQAGAMLAVGTSADDMEDLLQEPEFEGRACVAAVNSSASVTLSGDIDAIGEISIVLKDEKKFSRLLKVDKAYHSHHMIPCSAAYLSSLRELNIQTNACSRCTWFSSVYEDDAANLTRSLEGPYWDSNMLNPVLFKQAVERACLETGPFDIAIEIGPHPALKGPTIQVIQDVTDRTIPYTGLLQRGVDDIEALASGLGYISKHTGDGFVDFKSYDSFMSGAGNPELVKMLPPYCWNHKEYWHESRYSRAVRGRSDSVHELLGHLTPDSTEREMRWRHLLRPKEILWLKGHQLQNQMVFPAAGYVVSALEASKVMLQGASASTIEVSKLEIGQALTFDNADSSIETLFSVSNINRTGNKEITAKFTFNAATGRKKDVLDVLASGDIRICLGDPSPVALPARGARPPNLIALKADDFYNALAKLEYQYSDDFVALSGLERKLGTATGFIQDIQGSHLLVHPAILDASFQSVLLTASAPEDGGIWSMHVPRRIENIIINLELCMSEMSRGKRLPFDAFQPNGISTIAGDVDIFPEGSHHAMIQIEGLECVPFSPAMEKDDKILFSSTIWSNMLPNAMDVTDNGLVAPQQHDIACVLERMACFYLRELVRAVPPGHRSRREGPYISFFKFASYALSRAKSRGKPYWEPEWENDTPETIIRASTAHEDVIDVRLLHAIGQRLADIVMNNAPAIEIGMRDNLLGKYYKEAIGMQEYTQYIARTIKQLTFRSPRLQCLEIGAGTGGATIEILKETGRSFSSYTFTDVSSGFFDSAESVFNSLTDYMLFKVLDITKDPCLQGFEKHSYDLIIASMVLHATPNLHQTLRNVRRLLRPGGYLVVLEVQNDAPARTGTIFGAFPGWWVGENEGRELSPCVDLVDWDELLRKSGFSGCDTTTPNPDSFVHAMTVFVSQAVDDRMTFIRDPLSNSLVAFNSGHLITDLVILGGRSLKTAKLKAQLEPLLRPFCGNTKTFKCLAEIESAEITSKTVILSLIDLDRPIFKEIDKVTWDAMISMFQEAGAVLWITEGRRAANPYANMICGLLRSVINEIPGLDVQFIDFEDPKSLDARTIGEALLRFKAVADWKHSDHHKFEENSFTTLEREIIIEKDGRLVIPRMLPKKELNDRYNSSRRPISNLIDPSNHVVSLVTTASGYNLQHESEIFSGVNLDSAAGRITHSLLAPIQVAGRGQLFLSLGVVPESRAQFVAFSTKNTSALSRDTFFQVPVEVAPGLEASFLYLTRLLILASQIFESAEDGDKILIHEPTSEFITIVKEKARAKNINVAFTTSYDDKATACILIHPNSPKRALRNLNLGSVTAFLDLAGTDESRHIAGQLRSQLTTFCRCQSIYANVDEGGRLPSSINVSKVRDQLHRNVIDATNELPKLTRPDRPYRIVKPGDISEYDHMLAPQSIVDWSIEDKVLTRVMPIDSQFMFSGLKTYWLAGLSGSLGISLCEWMVRHGARYLVVSSRTPKVEDSWLEEMATLGAVIKICTCDLTKEDEVVSLYTEICSTLPQIGGVAQGAMVLQDTAISETSLETFEKVIRPKVDGSIHLNNLFQQDTLDFFVFFSSASVAIGTPGQSPYVAANMFMASLAEQRRQRGLAASVIGIGPIIGAGYIAQQQISIATVKKPYAYMQMSERDFHQLFTEGVAASRSNSIEIATGVRRVRIDEELQPIWAENPLMSHYLLNGESVSNTFTGRKAKEPLKIQLLSAQSHGDVRRLIKEALLEKLGILLQLDVDTIDQARLEATRLDELGLDSLMATEIRAWLLKNLQVNYPVLKILSGISIFELIEAAVDGIPQEMIPGVESSPELLSTTPAQADIQSSSASDSMLSETASLGDDTASTSSLSELAVDAHVPSSSEPVVFASMNLSSAQSMFWIVSQLFEDRASLNFAGACRITGPLNFSSLEQAAKTVGQQHEALRTRFAVSNGQVLQEIMGSSIIKLERREIKDDQAMAAAIIQTAEEVQKYHYNLKEGESLRLILLSSSPTHHCLIMGTSHLCMDGLSIQVFLTDLFRHYNKETVSQETFQYRDYVQLQRHALDSGGFEKEFRFWQTQYPNFPPPLPILRVSRARTRPSLTTFDDDRVEIKISFETKSQLQAVCRRCRVTPFHFYLACYRALLSRYADAEDLSIGIGDANRTEDRMMSGIGVFNNVLPLRFRTNLSSKFEDVLQETRTIAYAGLENSRIPFQALLERLQPPRSTTHTPILQCSVNYRQGQRKKEVWGDNELELLSINVSKTGYDLTLDINDDPKGDCLVAFIIRSDLYRKSEAEILIKSYERLVKAFATESNIALSQPSMYEHADTVTSMNFSRGQERSTLSSETVIHRIHYISQTFPNTVAIEENTGNMTYTELMRLSSFIATTLTASGVGVGSRIATLQEPTARWVASALAIMRIGAIYVPLDLSIPWARLATIVNDCNPDIVLLDDATKLGFHELQRPEMLFINVSELHPAQQLSPISATAKSPAIILYTSGSSGTPKGVTLTHEGIQNWIAPAQEIYGISIGAETILQQSACTFDMSFEQMFFALYFGGRLHLLPRSLRGDACAITDLIARKNITFTIATPTEYSSWLTHRHTSTLPSCKWRLAISGGEAATHGLVAQFRDLRKTDLRLFNSYGPTETTVIATSMELKYADTESLYDSIAAGFTLPNYSVYVVSEDLSLVPPEFQGEIYIGGPGVAIGYLNNPILTAEKFVPDVFATDEAKAKGWTTMHRTGDLGRWTKDGALIIEGRISGDTQIKIRGIRMDLKEIENAILKAACGSLTDVVVSVRRSTPESPQFLAAHVVFDSQHPEEEREGLLRSLPALFPLPKYMCPAAIIPIHQMPRTSSGKLDRKAIGTLPLQEIIKRDDESYDGMLTETEMQLRDIWVAIIQEQFKNSQLITPDTDFFHVGGTSLLLLSLRAAIRESFGVNLPVINLLEASTLETMAQLINNGVVPSDTIDWDEETRPSIATTEVAQANVQKAPRDSSVIVLTGSTGFLGRAILSALLADDKIHKVHCIAIRGLPDRKDIPRHPKLHLHAGDLTLPRLGLAADTAREIFAEADCVIHAGAQVSHAQSYRSLRAPNLQSTKELAQLCLPCRIPLHYISTAQVGVYYASNTGCREFPEVSAAAAKPPRIEFEGYAASKWASECFLERVQEELGAGSGWGWEVVVHRPTMISRSGDVDEERDIIGSIRKFAALMGAVPAVPNYRGFLETVRLGDVVAGIMGAVKTGDSMVSGVRFCHYVGGECISLDDPASAVFLKLGRGERETGKPVEELPPPEWAKRAAELGLHPHVVKWVESAAVGREQVFPRVVKGNQVVE
ncbi:uncharacterized protein GGS22DRAFT_61892 [Annulohypoxylon maeteangense]|uniref:uncharacterized protein n=1 Tax=Annulohypoxylon maeteangense TaxID=1927788 RepID=UPI0020075521|nr:uncharacterized protein GGS22DRAFT_61892 [Annulohypoxylon maeteangense]KAI0888665.1 hypothetical protein GGS22DRAFT_61892 [Annulohypoxylon maeteangense]